MFVFKVWEWTSTTKADDVPMGGKRSGNETTRGSRMRRVENTWSFSEYFSVVINKNKNKSKKQKTKTKLTQETGRDSPNKTWASCVSNFSLLSHFVVAGRILMDIPCKVCQDHSSGKHYGIYACDGCEKNFYFYIFSIFVRSHGQEIGTNPVDFYRKKNHTLLIEKKNNFCDIGIQQISSWYHVVCRFISQRWPRSRMRFFLFLAGEVCDQFPQKS